MNTPSSDPWHGAYKIPWQEPDFSRRMLAEHLSQAHDLASRRTAWIDKQVAWIHEHLLRGRAQRILDLGCGPGFYTLRLAALGHHCRGIDFGPAAIEYANEQRPDGADCEFVLGDLRQADFGGPYDLVMLLYGEFNVFSPVEGAEILRKSYASLAAGGRLIVEAQTPESVEQSGRAAVVEVDRETGLFCEGPHHCRTETHWLPNERVAVQTFIVTEAAKGETRAYRSTTKAWTNAELTAMLAEAGFAGASRADDWPCNTDALALWTVMRS